MDNAKLVVKQAGFSTYATVWGRVFGAWVTDKVIAREVTRNIILALVCVMATTAVLIAEPQTCIWIFLCVTLTLVDVCGFMYYWGLSVDIVSCIGKSNYLFFHFKVSSNNKLNKLINNYCFSS